ncbi:MAG TPA: aldolase/citrate lyase family protein [Rhizomicrobium sp.]|nr:aldolase/citrate lyase family protein [Rhizomicrobium sp.]
MKWKILSGAVCAAIAFGTIAAFAQANEDSVATAQKKYPLAAPAGVDNHAIDEAPPGAVNQGRFDDTKWKYGHAWDAPPGAKIWNPVKLKMMMGRKVTGGTLFKAHDPATYCAMANAGYDYIWTEMQHDAHNWQDVQDMWAACPYAKAVPGVRVAYTDEREEQHALDAGALVLVVPTVRSYAEAIKARDWAYFPPIGKRSNGGGQAFAMYNKVPGGYRNTINNNLVLVLMIETLDGLRDADRIAKIPGVTAIFAASGDLGNFGGYKQGDPDYEREINIVHNAALKAGVRLCGPFAWVDRPDFTCFQNGSEDRLLALGNGSIDRGAKVELGVLANTQPVPEVGPWARPSK